MRKLILGALLATVALQPIAQAQDELALEEVVVTAQRREQSLQDVPTSVTAFTGEMLQNANITEAQQYLSLSPNVSFTEDGQSGSRGISIAMRGVSNINTDESAFIQSIGIYLDEFSVSASANATMNPQLQDLERVEVLRGPQGTYFGRNAVGGALNLTTRKPTDEFEARVGLSGSSFDEGGEQFGIEGMFNAPITDNFFIRGVGYYEDSSGFVENIVPGGGDSGHEYTMARLSARWLASEQTTIDLMVMITDEQQGLDETVPSGVWDTDTVATFGLNNPSGSTFSTAQDDGTGFWPNNRSKVAHTAIGERNDNEASLLVIKVDYAFNDNVALKWITGFLNTEREKVFDNDLVPEDLVNRYEAKDADSWSSELRLEVSNDRFDWVIGALFAKDEIEDEPLAGAPGGGLGVVTGQTTAVDGGVFLGAVPGGNPDVPITLPGVVDFALTGALPPLFELGPGFFLYNNTPDGMPPLCLGCNQTANELDSIAIFTDFTFHATDQFDITVGFRYTEDKVAAEIAAFGLFRTPRIPDPTDLTGMTPLKWGNNRTFEDFSPRVAIGYQFNDDVRGYASVSKGYKAGGFSLGFGGSANMGMINQPFEDEKLLNYEVGVKMELMDRRLRINAAAFALEWDDLQLETFFFLIPGDATSNIARTINVQEAEAEGFELNFATAISDRFTLTGGIGVVNTEITSNDTVRISGNLTVRLQNASLPRAPELTANLAGDYRWELSSGNEAYVRAEWIHRAEQFSTIEDATYGQTSNAFVLADINAPAVGANILGQIPDRSNGFPFKTPSANIINLRAGYVWDDNMQIDLFIENAFDEEYYTGTGENFGLSGFRLRPHPRIIGARFSYGWH